MPCIVRGGLHDDLHGHCSVSSSGMNKLVFVAVGVRDPNSNRSDDFRGIHSRHMSLQTAFRRPR